VESLSAAFCFSQRFREKGIQRQCRGENISISREDSHGEL